MRTCLAGKRSTCVSSSVAVADSWYVPPAIAAVVPKYSRSASLRDCVPSSCRCRLVTNSPPRLMIKMASAGLCCSATSAPSSSVIERRCISFISPQSLSICSDSWVKPGMRFNTCNTSFSSSRFPSPKGKSLTMTAEGSLRSEVTVRVTTVAVRRLFPASTAPSPKRSRVLSVASLRLSASNTVTFPLKMKYSSSDKSPS
mmetsp:Transcript_44699/g.71741  ORF Transcript_44699/g.71741 Transcript_44699/m.71741 type:complete len:200 (-) Transcript_44699:2271-2870(-)